MKEEMFDNKIPETIKRIWVCSYCKTAFTARWLLSRHLKQVHNIISKQANAEAIISEWWRVYNPDINEIKR